MNDLHTLAFLFFGGIAFLFPELTVSIIAQVLRAVGRVLGLGVE